MTIKRLQGVKEQQGWKEQIRTSQFRLYAVPSFQPNVALDMTGHQIINVAYTEETGVPIMEVRWVQGKMTAIEKAEAARIKNATATMKYPHSLWTYLDGIQEFAQGRDCYWFLRVPEG